MSSWNDTQYVIIKKLGEGGMGTVFLAEDTLLKRKVAIKELHKQSSSGPETMDERFQQEALALARLNHPNITHLYSFLPKSGTYWMVMEYLLGESLEQWLQKCGRTTPLVAASIVVQLLDGLNHAHRKGIIHRDLKPANVMISDEGEVKIMDFGIARIRNSQRITQHGKSVGTLQYMAPEQIKGLEGDERTDIYAAGTILYELLSGIPPFQSSTDYHLMKAKLEDNIVALPASVPADLRRVIMKSLDRNPDRRYKNVLDFKDAIEECFKRRLLRENELFKELNKPGSSIVDQSRNAASLQKYLSDASSSLKLANAGTKLNGVTNIKLDAALYILIAVIILCGGLLCWNNSRQEGLAEEIAIPKAADTLHTPPTTSNQDNSTPDTSTEETATNTGNITGKSGPINNQPPPAGTTKTPSSLSPPKKSDSTKVKRDTIVNTGGELLVRPPAVSPDDSTKDSNEKTGIITSESDVVNAAPCKGKIKIPAGTQITMVLDNLISSEEKKRDGASINLTCSEDIRIAGCLIVMKGARVIGKILDVVPSASIRKTLVGFEAFSVEAANGRKINIDRKRVRKEASDRNSPAIFNKGESFTFKLERGELNFN